MCVSCEGVMYNSLERLTGGGGGVKGGGGGGGGGKLCQERTLGHGGERGRERE